MGNTFTKRHHIRLWRLAGEDEQHRAPVYLAAATHDVGTTFDAEQKRFTPASTPRSMTGVTKSSMIFRSRGALPP